MTSKKVVTVSFQETKATWEVINRHIDGLVFGDLLTPSAQGARANVRHADKKPNKLQYKQVRSVGPNSSR